MVKCDIMCARSAPEKKSHYFKFEIVLAVFSDNFKYEIIFQIWNNISNFWKLFHNILFQIGARSAPEKNGHYFIHEISKKIVCC